MTTLCKKQTKYRTVIIYYLKWLVSTKPMRHTKRNVWPISKGGGDSDECELCLSIFKSAKDSIDKYFKSTFINIFKDIIKIGWKSPSR